MIAFLLTYKILLINVLIFISAAYLLSVYLKRADIVDFFWGLIFWVIAVSLLRIYEYNFTLTVLVGMVAVWTTRLSSYLYGRLRRTSLDKRYARMSEDWGGGPYFYLRSYLQFFILQGLLASIVAFPLVVYAHNVGEHNFGVLNFIGLIIFITGLVIESVADYQLAMFKLDKKNKGKLLQEGLWQHSRHPNYFGEILLWWGIFVYTLLSPISLVGILGPALITYLIIRVSGVSMQERTKKGKAYKRYQMSTNALLPLPKKK